MKKSNLLCTAIILALLSLTTVSALANVKVSVGKSQKIGNGKVFPWLKFEHGNLSAIGVTFSEKALKNLPTEPPPGKDGTENTLMLPPEAANTVFKHIGFNWNPRGHEPDTIYDVGHFDFHFYLISPEERKEITLEQENLARVYKPLADEFVPHGYIFPPDSAVEGMGAHWIDPNSHEFHGAGFTKTFIYGSYDGNIIFLEPMITKSYLETKPNITEAIKLPPKYAKPGFYPTKYGVRYDSAKKEYTVALEGMVLR